MLTNSYLPYLLEKFSEFWPPWSFNKLLVNWLCSFPEHSGTNEAIFPMTDPHDRSSSPTYFLGFPSQGLQLPSCSHASEGFVSSTAYQRDRETVFRFQHFL